MINFVRYAEDGTVISVGFMVPEAITLDADHGERILEIEPREVLDWRGFRVDLATMQLIEGAPPPEPQPEPETAGDVRARLMPISDKQFFMKAAFDGIISHEDAIKAVQTGFIPPPMLAFIDTITDQDVKFSAMMLYSGATTIFRQHPLIEGFFLEQDMDVDAVNEFWIEAAKL